MELDKAIKERKTIRKFKKLDVPWYFVAQCLDSAIYAPNSGNIQNWHFIIVRAKEKKEKLVKLCEGQDWALNAPVLIVVCAELSKIRRMYDVRGEALYSVQNCAAAIQNLLLTAYALGLGTAWIGAFDEQGIKELLNIPADVRPQAIIPLGYSDDKSEKPVRQPLDNVVSFEEYGKRKDKSLDTFPLSGSLKRSLEKLTGKD